LLIDPFAVSRVHIEDRGWNRWHLPALANSLHLFQHLLVLRFRKMLDKVLA
jgi:hypothetical protein